MFRGIRSLPRIYSPTYICEQCLSKKLNEPQLQSRVRQQKRGISRNVVVKVKTAEEEWASRAELIRNGEAKSILELLEERGYVNQIVGTRGDLNNLLTNRRVGVYCGVDPTAPSLHVGHMVPLMVLGWMYIYGYAINFVLGGATVRIGDPTDRLKAREDVATQTRTANMASMHMQLKRLGVLIEQHAGRKGYVKEWAWQRALINNSSWYQKLTLLDFLKLFGKGARLGPLLGRDTVKNRLEKGDGMSFSEFTYPLIQAYDWWVLYQKGVQVQIGGADQFGNILAGADMVKYMAKNDPDPAVKHIFEPPPPTGPYGRPLQAADRSLNHSKNPLNITNDPMGFTTPLLTTSSGEKFGKSAGNAVWIDPDMTSSFDLYQFFLRSADADVERYLNLLTFVPSAEIEQVMAEHIKAPEKRTAQHLLAKEFIELVHGLSAAEKAEAEHRNLFNRKTSLADITKTTPSNGTSPQLSSPNEITTTTSAADHHPSLNKHAHPLRLHDNLSNHITLPLSLVQGTHLSKILWHAGLVSSRAEGQRLINARGVSIGGSPDGRKSMTDNLTFHPVQVGDWSGNIERFVVQGQTMVLRVGKWKVKIVNLVTDDEFVRRGLRYPGQMPDEKSASITQEKDGTDTQREQVTARRDAAR